jgi:hypothetical protein
VLHPVKENHLKGKVKDIKGKTHFNLGKSKMTRENRQKRLKVNSNRQLHRNMVASPIPIIMTGETQHLGIDLDKNQADLGRDLNIVLRFRTVVLLDLLNLKDPLRM